MNFGEILTIMTNAEKQTTPLINVKGHNSILLGH